MAMKQRKVLGLSLDTKEGNIRFQFPLRKGMEHFPKKKIKSSLLPLTIVLDVVLLYYKSCKFFVDTWERKMCDYCIHLHTSVKTLNI